MAVAAERTLGISQMLAEAAARLAPLSPSPREDAEWLLSFVLSCQRSQLRLQPHPSEEEQARFEQLLERRLAGEPVAYLLGSWGFWSLDLKVTPDVLIPRPDTERLVELALQTATDHNIKSILELGTGSGCIALALASELADTSISATDQSTAALAVARENARQCESSLKSNVHFQEADWYSGIVGSFDMILSNPPYIAAGDPHLESLQDPQQALVAEKNGLADLERIIQGAPAKLNTGGWLLLEHGWDQADAVKECLLTTGFEQVQSWQDAGGNDRVSGGCLP